MNEEEKKQLEELKRLVKELLQWKRERERQQLVNPLDKVSADIINNL